MYCVQHFSDPLYTSVSYKMKFLWTLSTTVRGLGETPGREMQEKERRGERQERERKERREAGERMEGREGSNRRKRSKRKEGRASPHPDQLEELPLPNVLKPLIPS